MFFLFQLRRVPWAMQWVHQEQIVWKENPNYEPGSYDIWGYYTYNNKPIFAHTCMEQDKKTYFYYNEGK